MNNSSICTVDRQEIIGGIIDVPNYDDGGEGGDGSTPTHHVCGGGISSGDGDDSTCKSELTWDDSVRPQQSTSNIIHQEPPMAIGQQQPRTPNSQGTTRRLHPFPWSISNENDIVLENLHIAEEQTDFSFPATGDAVAADETDRPIRKSSLVANESALDGKSVSLLLNTSRTSNHTDHILLSFFSLGLYIYLDILNV